MFLVFLEAKKGFTMKFRFIAPIIVVIGIMSLTSSVDKCESKRHKIPKKDRIDAAMHQEYMMTHDMASGKVPRQQLMKSQKILQQIAQEHSDRIPSMNLSWSERGPSNVGGRTRAILVDQSDPSSQTVFAAGVSGGLWKTSSIESNDPSWQSVDDFFGSLSICALAQDPSNTSILYFGTGEGYFEDDAVPGMGLWKSSDGGDSWLHLTSTANDDFSFVQKIVVDQNGFLYVSTFSGVHKSTNGGLSWTKVLGISKGAATDKANDLAIAQDGSIYASMGIYCQDGLYKSVDQGTSWTKLSTGLPSSSFHRIEFELAPSDNNTIYALFQDSNTGGCKGIYKSNNAGLTWTTTSNPNALGMTNFARTQAWYNLSLAVDPLNKERLYIGGIDLFMTANGGMSWTQVSQWSGSGGIQYVHADQHFMCYLPNNSDKLLFGNDGGIWYSNNAASSMPVIFPKNKGYNITQFYAATADPTPGKDLFIAGAQDNGTQGFNMPGINETVELSGGDGARCYIDKNNPNIQITSYVFNNYFVSTNGGNSFSFFNFNDHGLFANATDYDHNTQILYAASEPGKLLRWNNPAVGGNSHANMTINGINNDQISFVKVSPNVANRLYLGTLKGDVYYFDNAHSGTTKNAIKIRHDVDGFVSSIAIAPNNENNILVSYSNYNRKSIYHSLNGGTTWNDVEGNLPDMPVRDVIFNPEDIDKAILATELGVWVTDDLNSTNTTWIPNNLGLAQVRVDDLFVRESDKFILAATHGRGLYTSSTFGTTKVSFVEGTMDLMEMPMSVSEGPCQEDYYEVDIPIQITANPTSTETVTVSIDYPNSTSTNQRDYVLKNSSVSFTPSGSMTQYIKLRLLDDAIEENMEYLVLKLNPQSAQLGDHSSIQLTIRDNDYQPGAGGGAVEIGDGSATQDDFPFRGYYEDEKTQIIYRATELMGMGLQAGPISAFSLNVKTKHSTGEFSGFTVKMKHTSLNDANPSGVPFEQGFQTMYSANTSTVEGWNQFDFNQDFNWNGTDNIMVELCYNNNSWSDDDEMYCTVTPYNSVQYRYVDGNIGCNLSSIQKNSNLRPDARFYQVGGGIELANTIGSKNSFVSGGQTAHFYENGKLIMSIENLSNQNIACVTAELDGIGNGIISPTWLNGKSLNEKTFYVDADQDVHYRVSLYYHEDELSAWSDPDQLNIIKTPVPISDYSGGGFIIAENYEVDIESLSGGVKSYSTEFNGFSGFTLTDFSFSVVPLDLVDFHLTHEPGKYNELNWTVENEIAMDVHVIERSFDGRIFDEVGNIESKNQFDQKSDYQFWDRDLIFTNKTYYYRIKFIGEDGSINYSDLKSVYVGDRNSNVLLVFPNPFKSELNLELRSERGDVKLKSIEIRNLSGELIHQENFDDSSIHKASINLQQYPAAMYLLNYRLSNGKEGTTKITKTN